MKLFVYGSLKKDGSAHYLLKTAKFIKSIRTTKDYQLYSISWFPGMVKQSSDNGVLGELYDLPDEDSKALQALDRYEGPCFTKTEIDLEDGSKTFTYLFNQSILDCKPVVDGIWKLKD